MTRIDSPALSRTQSAVSEPLTPASPGASDAVDAYLGAWARAPGAADAAPGGDAARMLRTAFRTYQLRPRAALSMKQRVASCALAIPLGPVGALPELVAWTSGQTFTVRLHLARSLSFHVWTQFTTLAKSDAACQAIHDALKRHGVIKSNGGVLGKLGGNHHRALALPVDEDGRIAPEARLDARLDAVMEDLQLSIPMDAAEEATLRRQIAHVLDLFAGLNHDLDHLASPWRAANTAAKKQATGRALGLGDRSALGDTRRTRAELKARLTHGEAEVDL
jgi:hypothetical protein